MRKTVGSIAAVASLAVVLVLSACGGDDSSANGTAPAGSAAAGTDAPSGTATSVNDACSLVTIDEVAAVTQVEVTPDPQPSSATACADDSPSSGVFYAINLATLPKADQDAFDAAVAGQEQGGQITVIDDVGAGKAALVKHDVNQTLYARKGSTLVAITVFNEVNDPAAAAKQLMATALDRL
jgi:hypothetical protein